MADPAVDAGGDQGVSGLNGNQAAEAIAENENRINAQGAACYVQNHARPANGVAIDGPKVEAVSVRGEKATGQTEGAKSGEYPAIAAVFAFSGADVATGKERDD